LETLLDLYPRPHLDLAFPGQLEDALADVGARDDEVCTGKRLGHGVPGCGQVGSDAGFLPGWETAEEDSLFLVHGRWQFESHRWFGKGWGWGEALFVQEVLEFLEQIIHARHEVGAGGRLDLGLGVELDPAPAVDLDQWAERAVQHRVGREIRDPHPDAIQVLIATGDGSEDGALELQRWSHCHDFAETLRIPPARQPPREIQLLE
jgi:hypothetical protein